MVDIETTGLRPWYDDMITCICAKDSQGVVFQQVNEDNEEGELELIRSFLSWMDDRPPEEYFLITKEGKTFDIPFIIARISQDIQLMEFLAEVSKIGWDGLARYEHLDLSDVTTKRVALNTMAEILCCPTKIGTGANAIRLWEEGRDWDLQEYCMQDVLVTEAVYKRLRDIHTQNP